MSRQSSNPTNGHLWKKNELSLIGKISDAELGKRIGLPRHSVYQKRISMGIPPSRQIRRIKWGAREIDLLGKHPDQEVARRLGTHRKTVIEKRQKLGIPCYARTSKLWHTWTKREIAMLGKAKDRDVATKIGIPAMNVTAKRWLLGIPSFIKRNKGQHPRRLIGDWTEQEASLLGTMTDKEAAARLGVSYSAARMKRISLGISANGGSHDGRNEKWTPEVLARLGNEPDSQIARDIGLSSERLRQKRSEMGIGSFRSRKQ